MARRRRKNQDVLGIIGKVIVLLLVVFVGYYTYNNYGEKALNKINAVTNNKESNNKKENTIKDEKDNNKIVDDDKSVETTTEEKDKKYVYENQEGEKVTIKADKSVTATGFAGASNHNYFLRGTTLYYKNISSDEEEVILAYNVEDLFLENKEVTAVLSKNGKVVVENNYITYKNK